MTPDIYAYIKTQEAEFESNQIRVGDNWTWNFRDHVQLIFHLKNGVFYTGENDWLRAFKQVMRPMLRLSYWTEDIEVKDVTFFIEGEKGRALSFLIKKYHDEVYVREHDLDTLFDQITENDIDYGGVLTQRTNGDRPEVFALNSIAFCDQTDIMGGPIAFKHYFSPAALRRMSKAGWGEESNGADISINDLIVLAEQSKEPSGLTHTKENDVTGKAIEVYVIRGDLPEHYLLDNDNMEDWYSQVQIRAFYQNEKGKREGVCLYRKKEVDSNLKFHSSEPIHGRALGYSDGEALLHPQIWTNFLTIHKNGLLEAASKVLLQTDDGAFKDRNKIQDMENLEITTTAEGKAITQIPNVAPANIQLYEGAIGEWFEQSQLMGFAFDPIMGKEPNSGTTFRGQERTVAQGRGWHDRRRGQRAKFIEQIYRDWIIPDIIKEITKGKEFLATLSADELTWVVDQLATNYANQKFVEKMLNFDGEVPNAEERKVLVDTFKKSFTKGGNKKMLKILKDEFKDIDIRMGINIANKQKDLVNLSDKLLSIFQFVFSNPAGFQQAMQIPALAKSFYDILEFSGLSQADFLSLTRPPEQPMAQPMQPPQPMALNQPAQA